MESRASMQHFLIYDQNIFHFETRYLIKNILQNLINFEKISEKYIKEMYLNKNFSIKEIFEKICEINKNYILIEDVISNLK